MVRVLLALTVSLLAGLATSLGALVAMVPAMRRNSGLGVALSFAAGAMVTISVLEILPGTYDELAAGRDAWVARGLTALSAAAGVVLVLILAGPWWHRLFGRESGAQDGGDAAPPAVGMTRGGAPTMAPSRASLRRSGILVAWVVALHNVPEGMGTFLATVSDPALGIALAVAIAIHNIPEGVAVAAPILAATGSRARAIGWATCAGLAELVGALLGLLLIQVVLPESMVPLAFGLIAGMMVTISLRELLPTARRLQPQLWWVGAGVVGGALVMVISLLLLQAAG